MSSTADYEFALESLRKGESLEAIHQKLIERGLDPEAASSLLNQLILDVLYAGTLDMLNQGLSPEQVKQKLISNGIDPTLASAIVNDIVGRRQGVENDTNATGVLAVLLGILVVIAGIGLFIGNVTGLFPTFPCAGYLTITIGAAIWGWGRKHC